MRNVKREDVKAVEVSKRSGLKRCYVVEGLASGGANMLMTGVFFYTAYRFGWGPRENLLLAATQGAVYVVGALLASTLAGWLGRRRALVGLHLAMALAALGGSLAATPAMTVVALIVYTFLIAGSWPALESLVSSGADAHELSRRIGVYNLVWSGAGALTVAASGSIIQYWEAGVFLLPLGAHLIAGVLMLMNRDVEGVPVAAAETQVEPEPELLRVRRMALWLSRIALPSTFVVIFSLMAIMPSLPVVEALETTHKTLVGSVWLGARWIAFLLLGSTVWWHTRPRVLVMAAGVMFAAFLGITVRPSIWLGEMHGVPIDLMSMIAWQGALGLAMGLIYSASLYFGMVLSDGSTEHGGYHEALIGLGSVLGPGAGVIAQMIRPGDMNFGIAAVAGVIGMSVIAAGIAGAMVGRKDRISG